MDKTVLKALQGGIDFQLVSKIPFVRVLDELGLLDKLRPSLNELIGFCPFPSCTGRKDLETFSVNLRKGWFHCGGCKREGDVVAFVNAYHNKGRMMAGIWLMQFLDETLPVEGHTLPSQELQESELMRTLIAAGEQIIIALSKHADNPKPLAERFARWALEMLNT